MASSPGYNTAPNPLLASRRPHMQNPETFSANMNMLRRQSQLDEGFSEETRSQSDSDMLYAQVESENGVGIEDVGIDEKVQQILQLLLGLPAEARKRES